MGREKSKRNVSNFFFFQRRESLDIWLIYAMYTHTLLLFGVIEKPVTQKELKKAVSRSMTLGVERGGLGEKKPFGAIGFYTMTYSAMI